MKSILARWRRKFFGSYVLEDPRPIALASPYTFFLPSENELLALAPGDSVKAAFASVPPSSEWGAERMWVTVIALHGDLIHGTLANDPSDMPQLRHGTAIAFQRHHVLDIEWGQTRELRPPPPTPVRTYWERCLVDEDVVDGRIGIHYLYREAPETNNDDHYPDSGWRIRGDYRGLSDEELDARNSIYIAVGKVLNADDTWLHLIDAPIGAAFLRNWDSDEFEAVD